VGVKEYRRYLDLGIALLIDRGGHYEYYTSTSKNRCDRDVFLELELQPGTYMIVPLSSAVSLKRPSDATPKHFDLLTPTGDMHPLF